LLDLDGTTYISDQALPGAIEFLSYANTNNIPVLFFSNNPSKGIPEYVQHISKIGIPVAPEQIITSTQATIDYLHSENINYVYAVGTPGFVGELEKAGLHLTDKDPQAVVISFDLTLTYDKIKTAALLLHHNPTLPYIATNPDLVCPTDEGPVPDCGALIALLKSATGRSPVIIGKPHGGMVRLACHRLGLEPTDLAVIGDRLYTDILMGKDHGLTTILVLSGETTALDLEQADWKPDFVFDNLAELLNKLQQ